MVKSVGLLIAPLSLLLAGCAGSARQGSWLPDSGSEAARAYVQRCGSCHAAPHPRRLDAAAWEALLPVMERRMRERALAPLADDERAQILGYLRAHAR